MSKSNAPSNKFRFVSHDEEATNRDRFETLIAECLDAGVDPQTVIKFARAAEVAACGHQDTMQLRLDGLFVMGTVLAEVRVQAPHLDAFMADFIDQETVFVESVSPDVWHEWPLGVPDPVQAAWWWRSTNRRVWGEAL